ncbi:hypothetical protein ACFXKW_38040 [Streptomyces sp. NPDC059193]|uniref:hypothetical protein n=1 Tax=Streptomyces sp. NPDC059193 TaxID=3346763 RepID=UPI0036B4661C
MTYDIPRNSRGERICQQCHDPAKPLRPSLGTKPVIYCSKSCKQRAYEARKTGRAVRAAVAAEQRAAAAAAKSVTLPGNPQPAPAKQRDFAGPRQPVDDGDFLLAPPVEPAAGGGVLPDAWRAPAPASRRQLGAGPGRRRVGMTAPAIPLPFDIEDDDGI